MANPSVLPEQLSGLEGAESLRFGTGSAFVLAAACCWGLENNCTRMLSSCSSVQITTIKGIFSGLGSLLVALMVGEAPPARFGSVRSWFSALWPTV